MNENPRDPQQPDHGPADDARADRALGADDPTPRAATPDATADAATGVDASAPTTRIDEPIAAPKRGRGVLKPILVCSAAALTVLAVAGVGMTIADAVGDDDEPSSSPASSSEPLASGAPAPTGGPGATEPADDRGGDRDGDDDGGDDGRGDDGMLGAGAASSAPTDLVAAIDAAIAAAGGGSATSIEVEQGSWKVDVRLDDGSELDVRVPVSGDAVVREDDDDDRSSDVPLDPSRIADIVDAAVAAAGGGTVTSIETEDDDVRFEVEVAVSGGDVDVDLAEDLAVLAVER